MNTNVTDIHDANGKKLKQQQICSKKLKIPLADEPNYEPNCPKVALNMFSLFKLVAV